MYKVFIHGLIVECESLVALREVIGAYAGEASEIASTDAPLRAARVPAKTRSKASGPNKSWRMAEWYGQKENLSTTIARAKLAEIKRESFDAYQQLEAEFLASQKD
jgi:hypothetical protein